jgi:hypothetical protein
MNAIDSCGSKDGRAEDPRTSHLWRVSPATLKQWYLETICEKVLYSSPRDLCLDRDPHASYPSPRSPGLPAAPRVL